MFQHTSVVRTSSAATTGSVSQSHGSVTAQTTVWTALTKLNTVVSLVPFMFYLTVVSNILFFYGYRPNFIL